GRREAIGGDQADHLRAAEVDRPAAAQGLSATNEHELLVGAGVGEDFRHRGQAPSALGDLLGASGGGGPEFERAGAPAGGSRRWGCRRRKRATSIPWCGRAGAARW